MPMNPRTLRPRRRLAGSLSLLTQEGERLLTEADEELATDDGAAWTPALLGTQVAAWFDADDAATITLNGTGVSQWNDKSGNGRHVSQSTAAAQPIYTAGQLNGKPIVAFDNTNDRLLTTGGGGNGVTDVSFFVVIKFNSGGANEDTPVGIGQQNQTRQVRMLYRASAGTTLGFSGWANDISTSAYSCDIGGSYHIFGVRQAGQTVQVRRDGEGTNYTAPNTFLSVNSNNLFLGGIDNTRLTDGNFAEVLMFYTSINDETTLLVERYLSNKWGIALA